LATKWIGEFFDMLHNPHEGFSHATAGIPLANCSCFLLAQLTDK
jgi:hypothetical protein